MSDKKKPSGSPPNGFTRGKELVESTSVPETQYNTQDNFRKDGSIFLLGIASNPLAQIDDDVFVEEESGLPCVAPVGSGSPDSPYLDVVTSDYGGGCERKLTSVEMCHGSGRIGMLRKTGKYVVMPNCCKLPYCPDCSREGGPIEKLRLSRLFDRIRVEKCNIRAFVLTLPEDIREYYRSRKGLNALFKMATKIMYKKFGKNVRMSINPHLVGDEKDIYAPHMCVMIFEDFGVLLELEKSEIEEIREEWKHALEGSIKRKIKVVNVHYEFKIELPEKLHLIRYNVRANFNYSDEMIMWLSSKDFFKFSWLRFYGDLKKRGEKDMCDSVIEVNRLKEQIGDDVDWVADKVSMKIIRAVFGGNGLGMISVPGPYDVFVETEEARKKRGTKQYDFKGMKIGPTDCLRRRIK